MTDTERTYFRSRLKNERAKLEASLRLEDSSNDSIAPDNAIGRLTRMEALQAQSMSSATRARQQKRVRLINAALHRLDSGTYGQCVRCSQPIPRGRLDVMPEARICMDCAR